MENCYLKKIDYYEKCNYCSGNYNADICYSTEENLKKHLECFDELFKGGLEEKVLSK